MNDVIPLVIFAVVAVVILVNLYNVLGRKVGFRADEKAAAPKTEEGLELGARTERAVEGPRVPNLENLKTRDANFNEINFLEKARETYEQVVVAFHKGELDAVKDKLSEKVMTSFSAAVDGRSAPPANTISFVDAPKTDIDTIDFKEDVAQIRVRFLSELVYEDPTPVAAPEPVEAAVVETPAPTVEPVKKTRAKKVEPKMQRPAKVEPFVPHKTYKRTAEYWTFQKGLKSPNTPWLLTKVEAAKA